MIDRKRLVSGLVLLVAGFLVTAHTGVRAQVPQKINYQGYLTSAYGQPVTGTVSMTFRIYNGAGTELHTEPQSVVVSNGVFNAVLGTSPALTLPFDAPYFVGISVGADPEMTPRQALLAAPYARQAASALSLAPTATVAAANVTGTIGTAQIAGNAVTQSRLSPTTGAASGKVLGTDGANLVWKDDANSGGTVTSIQMGSGLAPGTITTSGTVSLATTNLLPGTACAVGQIVKWTANGWQCAADNDTNNPVNDQRYFRQGGNAFAGTAQVGTTDANAVEIVAGGQRAIRVVPNAAAPIILSGNPANSVAAHAAGATLSGGGAPGDTVSLPYPGGITLGINCTDNASNVTCDNRILDPFGTIGGGVGNLVGNGGPYNNSARYGTVGGGRSNSATGASATVAGGERNRAGGSYSVVAGGSDNQAPGFGAAVLGGDGNVATGVYSTVPGGFLNWAKGDFSVALGRRAKVLANGSFLFSDGTNADFFSAVDNEFLVGATGGVGFYTSKPAYTAGCRLFAGSGTWDCISDRAVKSDIGEIDPADVLRRVASMPISTWRFDGEPAHVRHIGPMSQDFKAAFGLGHSDKTIGTVDAQGVALAAIQGLYRMLESRDARIRDLELKVAALAGESRKAARLTMPRSLATARLKLPRHRLVNDRRRGAS